MKGGINLFTRRERSRAETIRVFSGLRGGFPRIVYPEFPFASREMYYTGRVVNENAIASSEVADKSETRSNPDRRDCRAIICIDAVASCRMGWQ